MDYYLVNKTKRLSGTNFQEVLEQARAEYQRVVGCSRRTPYLRSRYFQKQKIFLAIFWSHIFTKTAWGDQLRRLKYYSCAIELLRNSSFAPTTKQDPNDNNFLLHRFYGKTAAGERFVVQVKENKRTGRKDFLSVFPE